VSQTRGHGDDVAGTDDLTRIAGIGAKTAERLNAAGIRNYADLASRSADDLVVLLSDVAGMSSARLDGWRDQARELATATADEPARAVPQGSGPEDSVPEVAGEAPSNGQHYESFVVRVLLNTDGSIRRTTAQHVGTGTERHWPGLERQALSEFIEEAASPRLGERSPRLGERGLAPTPIPTVRVEAQGGQLASSAGLSLEHTLLRAAEPFTMTMTIDFAGPAIDADRLAYSAVIVAKPMVGGPKQTVAQAHGLFATRSPTISIGAKGLPPGAYRLDAAVSLREPGSEHALGLAAMAEGLLVHVLPG
jgi:hypothetical protein